jgi:hypothetical protein
MTKPYASTRRDFEYLESIAELDDWVTLMDELENFMRQPTKAFAADLYGQAIWLWLMQHGTSDKGAARIAKKHGFAA